MTNLFDQKQLIPFNVIGDPDAQTTIETVLAEVAAGAQLIELGLPFSDPVADGPAVKAANQRALQGQLTVAQAFTTIATIRQQTDVALALVTYANIPFVYGFDAFAAKVAELGITTVIVPDMPHEESHLFRPILAAHGVDFGTIVGPATPERIAEVVADATDFLTVFPALPQPLLGQELAAIRAVSDLPIVINTPTSDPATVAALAQLADGVQLTEALLAPTTADVATTMTQFIQALV
ncbi:MAG TPA: tryptophan synthase subunit alpha [Levilactobacillus hammesii]|uniref:tryptophan synthase n=1 Tax=Levilactobacillus hammesii TaxID=267633 RepID=A0A921EXU9_9LACO|nr:tryptophan synthase subunit alpha [Levilactobacillus hammesii]